MIKVLLIDDDELANELVAFILEFAGITDYTICTTGEDALAWLNTSRHENNFPDIIFVDINMPGMDGFEFVKQYENEYNRFNPETRIILLTNSVLANEKKQAGQLKSVYGFWNKPLTQARLKELIDSVWVDNQ